MNSSLLIYYQTRHFFASKEGSIHNHVGVTGITQACPQKIRARDHPGQEEDKEGVSVQGEAARRDG